VADWALDPGLEQAEGPGRASASFAVAVVAPVAVPGGYALVLTVNGEVVRHLPFTVVVDGGQPPGA
jgi:hypothetical protein